MDDKDGDSEGSNYYLKTIMIIGIPITYLYGFLGVLSTYEHARARELEVFGCNIATNASAHPYLCDGGIGWGFVEGAFCCLALLIIGFSMSSMSKLFEALLELNGIPWLMIFAILTPAIIGINVMHEENNSINEQLDEIEDEIEHYNYNKWTVEDIGDNEYEALDLDLWIIFFFFSNVFLFTSIFMIIRDDSDYSPQQSHSYQNSPSVESSIESTSDTERNLKAEIRSLNQRLSQSKTSKQENRKLRIELDKLIKENESLEKSKTEVKVNQTIVYNISDSVITGDDALSNQVNINSEEY